MTDGWSIAGTVAIASSSVVTAVMAWYTRSVAVRTAEMAKFARDEVEAVVRQGAAIEQQAVAMAEQVRLAQAALVAEVQPWLTLGESVPTKNAIVAGSVYSSSIPPLIVRATDDLLKVVLAVRNVGNGLAIIDSAESYLIGWSAPTDGDELRKFTQGAFRRPVLPPGDQSSGEFTVELPRWNTSLDVITRRPRNYGEFAVDVVYGDVLGEHRSRLRAHIAGTKQGTWIVHRLDYYSPGDTESPLTSVRVG